jgi:membrane-associated phospholipid phosphatase
MSLLMRFNLVVIASLGLLVFVWGSLAGFSFPPLDHYTSSIILASVFGGFALIYTFLRPDRKIADPCWVIMSYAICMPVMVMISYLPASLNFPLVGSALVKADLFLGFKWMESVQFFIELPAWVSIASSKLYETNRLAMLMTLIVLIFSGRHKRLDEFLTLFIVTGTVTCLISGILPAVNAYEFFLPNDTIYDRLSPVVGRGYYDDFFALRDGSLRQLKLRDVQGLVSFPSFHTILALLLIYVMRGTGIFFAIMLIWNVGIILTTPFDGAHYLVDIVAGGVVMVAAVYFVRWLEPWLASTYAKKPMEPQLVPQLQ